MPESLNVSLIILISNPKFNRFKSIIYSCNPLGTDTSEIMSYLKNRAEFCMLWAFHKVSIESGTSRLAAGLPFLLITYSSPLVNQIAVINPTVNMADPSNFLFTIYKQCCLVDNKFLEAFILSGDLLLNEPDRTTDIFKEISKLWNIGLGLFDVNSLPNVERLNEIQRIAIYRSF